MSVLASGIGRVRQRSRHPARVERTPWLAIALGATVVQVFTALWAAFAVGRLAFLLLGDDLLVFLALIIAPMLLLAAALALASALSLGVTARKLVDADAGARTDLAVAGTVGLLAGGCVASVGLVTLAIVLAAPAAIALVVVFVPDAWRSEDGGYFAR